jgi:hypothetical protein
MHDNEVRLQQSWIQRRALVVIVLSKARLGSLIMDTARLGCVILLGNLARLVERPNRHRVHHCEKSEVSEFFLHTYYKRVRVRIENTVL